MRSSKISWPLILSGLSLIAAILMCNDAWKGLERYKLIFYSAPQATILFTFLIIPLVLLITLFQFRHVKQSTVSIILSLFILFVSNFIGCAAILPLLVNPTSQIQTLASSTHIYHLDSMFSPGIGGDHCNVLMLWECDRLGVFCQIVHTKDFYDDLHPSIEFSSNDTSLLFKVNSQTVFALDNP